MELTQEQTWELKDLVCKIANYMHEIHDSIEGNEGEPEAWSQLLPPEGGGLHLRM